MDLRALTHDASRPDCGVTCRMEGDTFEMEDQRNWTDASYKTYVRPLALPWPYTLAAGNDSSSAVALSGRRTPAPAQRRRAAARWLGARRRGDGRRCRRSASASIRRKSDAALASRADLARAAARSTSDLPPRPAPRA